jgi:hypothetical protein
MKEAPLFITLPRINLNRESKILSNIGFYWGDIGLIIRSEIQIHTIFQYTSILTKNDEVVELLK